MCEILNFQTKLIAYYLESEKKKFLTMGRNQWTSLHIMLAAVPTHVIQTLKFNLV